MGMDLRSEQSGEYDTPTTFSATMNGWKTPAYTLVVESLA